MNEPKQPEKIGRYPILALGARRSAHGAQHHGQDSEGATGGQRDRHSVESGVAPMRAAAVACLLACALLPAPLPAGAQPAANPSEFAAKVQQRLATIRDFSGDFVQTYEGGVLRTKTTERGTMSIKRPGRMRWVYSKPERKEFVSDGLRLYTYLVQDKQVIVGPAPNPGDGTVPALFLAGQADLAKDFTPSFMDIPGARPGVVGLRLVPKKADPDYEWLALGVDPNTLQIQHLIAQDRQGGRSAFGFSNLKENRGLTDKEFEFRIPRGVDVITNGSRTQ
jgi:outer membrane lipoprotein carrier protein